jgi:hypothetical protein
MQLQGRLGIVGFGLLWLVLVPTRVLLGFGSGYLAQGLDAFILVVLIYAALRRRVLWSVVVAGVIATALVIPARAEFRALTWRGEAADLSPHEKVLLLGRTVQEALDGEGLAGTSFEVFMYRLSHVLVFAEVVRMTPEIVPFWDGETYYPLLFKAIPRALYPEKPVEVTGQTFGHRYGFLDMTDFDTSFNLPQLVEFFINFGVVGLVVGMFLIGVLYRAIQHMFMHSETGLGAVVVSSYVFSRLLLIESALSLVLGGIAWALILLGLLHLLLKVAEGRRLAE